MIVLIAVDDVFDMEKSILFEKFNKHFNGNIKGKKVAIWGLAFKPETDDMREAPSLVLIDSLLKAGCVVSVYDPVAMNECKCRIGESIFYAPNMYDTLIDPDAIFHLTEWTEFRMRSCKIIRK